MVLLALLGQLVMSIILDSIGAFGLVAKPIALQKILGLGIIIGLYVFFSKELKY